MPTDEDWKGYTDSDAFKMGLLLGFRKNRRHRAIATHKRAFLSWKTPPRPDPLPGIGSYDEDIWMQMLTVVLYRRPRVIRALDVPSPLASSLNRLRLHAYLSGMKRR